MKASGDSGIKHSYRNSGSLSRIFFVYVYQTLRSCYQKNGNLTDADIIDMTQNDNETQAQFEAFQAKYQAIKERSGSNVPERDILMSTIYSSFKWSIILIISLSLLCDGLSLFYSYYIKYLIQFIKDEDAEWTEGVWKAVIFILALFLSSVLRNQVFFQCLKASLVLKKLMILLIYSKISKMRAYNLQDSIVSKQISLISSEFVLIERLSYNLPIIITLPFLNLAAFLIIYFEIGWQGALITFAVSFSMIMISTLSKNCALKANLALGKQSDKILMMIRAIISGIKVLKCSCLENHYMRKLELERRTYGKLGTICGWFLMQTEIYLSYFGFFALMPIIAFFINKDGYLDNAQIMGVYSLILFLFRRVNMLYGVGTMIFVKLSSAVIRLSEIMKLPETYLEEINTKEELLPTIEIEDGSFSWKPNSESDKTITSKELKQKSQSSLSLKSINLKIDKGLVTVIGSVGSGKTTFLNSILRETYLIEGKLNVRGSISYAEQEPYLISGSIKENILFGKELNQQRLNEAIQHSCLQFDIDKFPEKEETLIGEKGRTLSGGQKARLSLARALYSNSHIYLLDDPLSAVDTQVASKIYNDCILGYLKDKIVILSTHQIQFLSTCQRILVLEQGVQILYGSYPEIMTAGYKLENFRANEHDKNEKQDLLMQDENFEVEQMNERSLVHEREVLQTDAISENNEFQQNNEEWVETQKELTAPAKIIIGFLFYYKYYSYYGGHLQIIYSLVILAIATCLSLAPSYILSKWSSLDKEEQNVGYYFQVFCGTIGVFMVFSVIRGTTLIALPIMGNSKLFNENVNKLIRAKQSFFDKSNSGQILTLFTKDFSLADSLLSTQSVAAFIALFTILIGIISVVVVMPYLLIAFVILIVAFVIVYMYIQVPFRETHRLETLHRGPLHQSLIQIMQGITSIRSANALPYFRSILISSLELGTNACFTDRVVSRWFNNILDYQIVVFTSIAICLAIGLKGKTEAALLSYCLQVVVEICMQFALKMRIFSEIDNSMLSVYHIVKFKEVESEDLLEKEADNKLGQNWPIECCIEFKNVNLRYEENKPLALTNLNFKIDSGMHVGIVGRTGAGKSSLLQAVLRLANIEDNGLIEIDGVDTKKIGLHLLRRNIGYIPQTPFFLEGTIAQNLDPTGTHTSQQLSDVLRRVQLWDSIQGMSSGLDTDLQDFNQIFSIGQQQLFCLARALLQKCKILVVDEATANVDYETDSKIQEQLRSGFVGCTLMIIAHRLQTVIDCDKILVMSEGRNIEFDRPLKLLAESERDSQITKKGYFAKMVKATGKENAQLLFNNAKRSFLEKQTKS